MPAPTTEGSPNRYQPNPADDRAIREATKDGPEATAYFAITSALDSLEDVTSEVFRQLDPGSRKALRGAENALRRGAFSLVVHARHADG